MANCSQGRLLQLSTLAALLVWCSTGSYIITTPRKWTTGGPVQICMFSVDHNLGSANETLEVRVRPNLGEKDLVPPTQVYLLPGMTEICDYIQVPKFQQTSGKLQISGTLGGKKVQHNKTVSFATSVSQTFVQTDKYLYMPGQEVKFRILTVTGPYLKISTDLYPLVWIESPSGSRIAQWLNLENPAGLIHHAFQLSDEPEEGTYKIHVESPVGGRKAVQKFKVEEFVLPRFEVTITKPPYILGTDTRFSYKICATYTYGQPVKGNLSISLTGKTWGSTKNNVRMMEEINGCKTLNITEDTLKMYTSGSLVNTVILEVTVVETGTGQEAKAEARNSVERNALKFQHIGDEEYVKPNLPFRGKFKVKYPDGSPVVQENMKICQGQDCSTMVTDSKGIVYYVYPEYKDLNLRISAPKYPRVEVPDDRYRSLMYESFATHSARRYFSPSGSSLIIQVPEIQLKCRTGLTQKVTIPVMFSSKGYTRANITIQLISRGQIQYTRTQEYQLLTTALPINSNELLAPLPPSSLGYTRGVVSLLLTVPLTSSPTGKLLVWYTRDDGEVVSDSKEVKIRKCLTNHVGLSWSADRAGPGDQVDLEITAAPNSLCSLGVVDKSVELLSSGEDPLTLQKVFDVVERAMVGENENSQVDDGEYCTDRTPIPTPIPRPRPPFRPNWPPGPPGPPGPPVAVPFAPEPETALAKRSIRLPGRYYTNYVDAIKMFDKSGLFVFTDLNVETRPCEFREYYLFMRHLSSPFNDNRVRAMSGPGTPVLYGAPDFAIRMAGFDSSSEKRIEVAEHTVLEDVSSSAVRSYFPETWLWALTEAGETGSLNQSVTLPHTITEWVGKAVCVHPEEGVGLSKKASITAFTSFFIDLTLPPSVQRGEILPVKISVFNYLHEDLPVRVTLAPSAEYDILDSAEGMRSSCIPSQDKVVHTVKIRPHVLGDVNLTVEAAVDEVFPEVCGPEYVVAKRDHLIKSIPVELEGFPQEKTWTKYICTNDTGENEPVEVSWPLELPSDIVPDSARAWVTAVGDLLGPTLDNLGSLVKMPYGCGEQNMLNFAPNIFILQYLSAADETTPDIAEKAIKYMKSGYQRELRYRHADGSFSAFGPSDESGSTWLTAFVLKSFSLAQQFISIDNEDINMSREWLKRDQMENGCFLSKGKVFHKAMKGGIANDASPVPLTAYILIALLESGEIATSRAVTEAAFCLVSDKTKDYYTLALKSYALALAEAPEANVVLNELLSYAISTSDGLYWEVDGSGKSEAAGVETAGYAVLAMAAINPSEYLERMRMAVRWISSKRNGQGGFISTQDTVVALQALATFETVLDKTSPRVDVLVYTPDLEHGFRIDHTNKLLLQRVDVPTLPTTVNAVLTGDGCALVQAVLRYNIPEEAPSQAFSLSVNTTTAPDENCVTKRIKTCAKYQLSDKKSNMAVIEVNLVSGYIPKKADLKQLVGYGTGLIKRYEVDGRKVTFYIDEIPSSGVCVDFKVTREVDVEDAKPGSVRVYDYYQPEYFVSQKYMFPAPEECLSGPPITIEGIIVDPIVL